MHKKNVQFAGVVPYPGQDNLSQIGPVSLSVVYCVRQVSCATVFLGAVKKNMKKMKMRKKKMMKKKMKMKMMRMKEEKLIEEFKKPDSNYILKRLLSNIDLGSRHEVQYTSSFYLGTQPQIDQDEIFHPSI